MSEETALAPKIKLSAEVGLWDSLFYFSILFLYFIICFFFLFKLYLFINPHIII